MTTFSVTPETGCHGLGPHEILEPGFHLGKPLHEVGLARPGEKGWYNPFSFGHGRRVSAGRNGERAGELLGGHVDKALMFGGLSHSEYPQQTLASSPILGAPQARH